MKKGNAVLTIIGSIIGAIIILSIGSYIFSTTLNIVDDEALAVTSMRQIATAVNSAETLDRCASAELQLSRNYQLNASENVLELYSQEFDKEGKPLDDAKLVDSISVEMDGRIFCESESPQCKHGETGLSINPIFDREIDQTFCVCNIYDYSVIFVGTSPLIIFNTENFAMYPKGATDFTCDNPVSSYQA